jgi:hypothetical protein
LHALEKSTGPVFSNCNKKRREQQMPPFVDGHALQAALGKMH